MTDNEIIKALECRVKSNCPKCPYFQSYPCDKCKKLDKDTLDLINRLQAENERLTIRLRKVEHQLDDLCKMHHIIKSEARKEFAERLHEYINGIIERHEMPMFPFSIAFVSGIETKIDNLLKERESDDND